MKPLTSDTLAKAAIIEGYCWEIAALEVSNKNTDGARYFMGLADSLHAMYELGHDGVEAPEPMAGSGYPRGFLLPKFPYLTAPTTPAGTPCPSMPETAEVPPGSVRLGQAVRPPPASAPHPP